MSDNKKKTYQRDRLRVAGNEDYEVNYLSDQAGITIVQARELIRRFGNDRQTLQAEAEREKAKLGRCA